MMLLPQLSRPGRSRPSRRALRGRWKVVCAVSRDDVDAWIGEKRPHRRSPTHVDVTYLMRRDIVSVCTPKALPRLKQPGDLMCEVLLHHTIFPDPWARWARATT